MTVASLMRNVSMGVVLFALVESSSAEVSLRHLILGKWTSDALDDQKATALACLKALPASVPEISSYEVGTDLGVTTGNWEWGLIGEFATVENFEAYEASAPHQNCLSLLKPILADKAGLEFNASASLRGARQALPQLRHLILGKWTEDSTANQQAAGLACLQKLPVSVPQIASYEVGTDLGVTSGNYQWGLIGEFTSVDNFEAYEASDPHQECLSLLKPILAVKAGLEFDADADRKSLLV